LENVEHGMALLIDIEGIDGSGKGTQSARLVEWLQSRGFRASVLSFPRYAETHFGGAIGQFLNGDFGPLDAVHPLLASLLFAGDRFESRGILQQAAEANDVLVLDRYVASNLAHQGARASGPDRDRLVSFIERLEFEVYGLPRPHLVLLFDLPVAVSMQLVPRKAPRSYTERTADIQESAGDYLDGVRSLYLQLAETRPGWHLIPVCNGDQLRTIDDVADDVVRVVSTHLPRKPL
jgi:dTMP kinase